MYLLGKPFNGRLYRIHNASRNSSLLKEQYRFDKFLWKHSAFAIKMLKPRLVWLATTPYIRSAQTKTAAVVYNPSSRCFSQLTMPLLNDAHTLIHESNNLRLIWFFSFTENLYNIEPKTTHGTFIDNTEILHTDEALCIKELFYNFEFNIILLLSFVLGYCSIAIFDISLPVVAETYYHFNIQMVAFLLNRTLRRDAIC